MYSKLISFIREQYQTNERIPLHAPIFEGNEKKYVDETIDSTFVSSVGPFVNQFENLIANYTGSQKAVATVNGTAALHTALLLANVQKDEFVLTQPLTFVATCNAIAYCGASPIFIDVDRKNLGLSPSALEEWLNENVILDTNGYSIMKVGGKKIRACVVMHTFGHPAALDELLNICSRWGIVLIEDAAESLGSLYKGRHTGTFGQIGTLSFNGNKIITTGGGGMILADDKVASRAKHLTTTAKLNHPFEYIHDEIGFNYRMPNINAALGCAQIEKIEEFVSSKRKLAARYSEYLKSEFFHFINEPENCRSNYWLNSVICESKEVRDTLLRETNENGVMTRPIWCLMSNLVMYKNSMRGPLVNAEWLEARVVNLPSSVLPKGIS